jgi:tetratricopeptide (TPR) repeat protein
MQGLLRGFVAAGILSATVATTFAFGQAQTLPAPSAKKAAAYYHASLGHLYAELASQYGGRGEYVSKAIENYKLAMKADPETPSLAQELADLYLQSGQLRTATSEFEEVIKRNPDDLNARRILARFYTARIRESQQGRMNEEMLKLALEQYTKISDKAPRDTENWLMLGRLQKLAQNSRGAEIAYQKALAIDPENEDALTGLAMVYTDLGDNARAGEMLKKVAEKSPNLRTLAALAATYEQAKDYKLAAETYKRALDLNKENMDLKRAYGQALFSAEDYETATKVFEEVVAEEPNDLLASLRLSQIYRQKRDFAKARTYAAKASKLDPSNLEILYNEVSLLEAEGKTPEAIAKLQEILAGMPKKSESVSERSNRVIILERLGILQRMSEQTAGAVATFREIIELDPEVGARATAQIIDAYRAGKEYASAEKEVQAALKKYPQDRVIKVMAANVKMDLAQYKEAEALLKPLLDGKSDRETYITMAQLYEKSKNYTELSKSIDSAEKLSTTPEEKESVYFLRGAMYERMKKYDLAEIEFKKVLEISPDSPAALNYLGYMLADRNIRLNEALEMIQKAVDLDPYNSAYLDSLGWAYFRLNRLEDAAEQLQRSLARGSRDATVHDHLGDVYAGQNKLKEAIAQWDLAIHEWHNSAPSEVDPAEVAKIQKKLENAKIRLAKETGTQRREQ